MIIYRAMVTPDGTTLQSKHRHDFVGHEDKNGNFYAIDGGLAYCRITAMDTNYKIIEVDDSEPFEIVRQFAYWQIKDNTTVPIAKMSDDKLSEAIGRAQKYGSDYLALLLREEHFRNKWKINVNDKGELQ